MKKILLFLIPIFLMSCKMTCLIGQIPPQVIYADQNCSAKLPDYTTKVTVVGGCTNYVVTQNPLPGYLLSAVFKTTPVTLTATGANMKTAKVTFMVNMVDTITPKIIPSQELLGDQLKKINDIYTVADNMIARLDSAFQNKQLMIISYDSAGTRQRDIVPIDTNLMMNLATYKYN